MTLAIQGATPLPVANSTSSVDVIAEERLFERVHLLRIALVQQDAKIALRSQHKQLVGIHRCVPQRLPQLSNAMPSGHAPLPRFDGPKISRSREVSHLVDAQAGDASARGLDHVHPLLRGVEPDLVGEMKSVGHDAEFAVV